MPYGHMPVHEGEECGPPDGNGNVRERVQTNGRCESANDRGDTYGPITYLAYVPGYLAFGWSGKWDELPGGALLGAALRRPDADRARARRLALRPGPARRHAPLRVGRVPVHAVRVELERERRPPAVPARVRLLARDVRARARPVRRPRVLGEVRRAAPDPALGVVSGRSAAPTRGRALRAGLPRRHGARLLGAPARARPAPRRARLLGPDVRLPAGPGLTVLHLGLGGVPGLSGSLGAADGAEGPARRRRPWSAACFPAARRRSSLPL